MPSGASTNQLFHYVSEIASDSFGNDTKGSGMIMDFDLSRVRVPTSIHYSYDDNFANVDDVKKLITKLGSYVARVHVVNHTQFNHADFLWGKDAPEFVYKFIASFFNDY